MSDRQPIYHEPLAWTPEMEAIFSRHMQEELRPWDWISGWDREWLRRMGIEWSGDDRNRQMR